MSDTEQPDALAQLLVRMAIEIVGHDPCLAPAPQLTENAAKRSDWLRAHRAELFDALGGEIETSYEREAGDYFKGNDDPSARLWSCIGAWLSPGDEVWTFYA